MLKHPDDLSLYIIMRSDSAMLASGGSNPQAAHAQRCASVEIERELKYGLEWQDAYTNGWGGQTEQGYGRVIVLSGTERDMRGAIDLSRMAGFPAAVINDPEFGIKDGSVRHFASFDTCGYIFGSKAALEPLLARLPLFAANNAGAHG